MMEVITFLRLMNICIEIFQTDHLEDIRQLPLERNSRDGTDKTDSDSSNAESNEYVIGVGDKSKLLQ